MQITYTLPQTHSAEINYMTPAERVFFTEGIFSTKWRSATYVTFTVSEERRPHKQTWFWLHLNCRTFVASGTICTSWQILDCMPGEEWNITAPFLSTHLSALFGRKKRRAQKVPNSLLLCFSIPKTASQRPGANKCSTENMESSPLNGSFKGWISFCFELTKKKHRKLVFFIY